MPKIVATKEDWVKLGYELFSESGAQGLNVDKMSRLLKCNKSSFYWHFKTKTDFIDCLFDYWVTKDTDDIIVEVNSEILPQKKLIKLIEISFQKNSDLDFIFYLKKYAQSNKRLAKIVDRIDKERIEFVSELLNEMGYNKKAALSKAKLFYKYLIGYHEMIRYKKQPRNYLVGVLEEISHFIKIEKS